MTDDRQIMFYILHGVKKNKFRSIVIVSLNADISMCAISIFLELVHFDFNVLWFLASKTKLYENSTNAHINGYLRIKCNRIFLLKV